MSDRIEGIAVFDERGPVAHLHFKCVRSNGDRPPFHGMIPIRPRGSPEIAGWHTWEYDIRGDRIHVTPSVLMKVPSKYDAEDKVIEWREIFHNDGDWEIRFERYVPVEESSAYQMVFELNPGMKSKADS